MLLAVDIGNTNIHIGLFEDTKLRGQWRLSTDGRRSPDEYRALLTVLAGSEGIALTGAVTDVAIGSVVPALTETWQRLCRQWWGREALLMDVSLDLGMEVRVREPRRVGVDRLLNALAARAQWGAPCIVLDFGTATKFDVVGPDGAFLGGAIAPGLQTAAEALVRQTAQLPRIPLVAPAGPIGDDTVSAMQAGIVLGYIDLVEGLLRRIRAALARPAPVIATGGLAGLWRDLTTVIDHYEPTLTLQGLRLVYERNGGLIRSL